MNCKCATEFEVRLARLDDYKPFKRVLDIGKHPAFIGRGTFTNCCTNGGALFYFYDGSAAAVSMISPRLGSLGALNVHPSHRGHGLGSAIVRFLVPNFIRAIDDKVPYFQRLGYVPVGKPHKGISRLTQLMVRECLIGLAGKVAKAFPASI